MHKIGVIGDRDSVIGFKAVGLDVFPCATADEAKKILRETAKNDYAILFITEKLAKDLRETINQYKDELLPAIVPVPGTDGNYGVGLEILKKSVERAIGADILFGGEQ